MELMIRAVEYFMDNPTKIAKLRAATFYKEPEVAFTSLKELLVLIKASIYLFFSFKARKLQSQHESIICSSSKFASVCIILTLRPEKSESVLAHERLKAQFGKSGLTNLSKDIKDF